MIAAFSRAAAGPEVQPPKVDVSRKWSSGSDGAALNIPDTASLVTVQEIAAQPGATPLAFHESGRDPAVPVADPGAGPTRAADHHVSAQVHGAGAADLLHPRPVVRRRHDHATAAAIGSGQRRPVLSGNRARSPCRSPSPRGDRGRPHRGPGRGRRGNGAPPRSRRATARPARCARAGRRRRTGRRSGRRSAATGAATSLGAGAWGHGGRLGGRSATGRKRPRFRESRQGEFLPAQGAGAQEADRTLAGARRSSADRA